MEPQESLHGIPAATDGILPGISARLHVVEFATHQHWLVCEGSENGADVYDENPEHLRVAMRLEELIGSGVQAHLCRHRVLRKTCPHTLAKEPVPKVEHRLQNPEQSSAESSHTGLFLVDAVSMPHR